MEYYRISLYNLLHSFLQDLELEDYVTNTISQECFEALRIHYHISFYDKDKIDNGIVQ